MHHGRVISSVIFRKMKSVVVHVNHRPTLIQVGKDSKILFHLHFRDCRTNIDSIFDRFRRFVSLREFRWRHVCVAPAMFVSTDIHRFVCDTMITTGQEPKSVLTRKKRFLFPHERPDCECKKGETGSRQIDVWGFPAKTQLDFFAKDGRARARGRAKNEGRESA